MLSAKCSKPIQAIPRGALSRHRAGTHAPDRKCAGSLRNGSHSSGETELPSLAWNEMAFHLYELGDYRNAIRSYEKRSLSRRSEL